MYGFPSQDVVKRLREEFPEGTRVALVHMDDPYSKLVPGDRGSVKGVDDGGTIHVSWDKGSSLGIAYGEDSCRKLTEKELAEEQTDVEVSQKINVLIVEPDKAPYMKEIDSGLESLQKIVKGSIEAFYPFEDQVGIICNEEGKISRLPLNRAVYGEDKKILDIMAGTFIVAGLTEDNFGSLSPEFAEKYADMFKYPEIFVRAGNEIVAVPQKPSVRDNLKSKTAEIKKDSQENTQNKSEHEI